MDNFTKYSLHSLFFIIAYHKLHCRLRQAQTQHYELERSEQLHEDSHDMYARSLRP